MRVTLEIPQQVDMDWLLRLFQQLNLRVVNKLDVHGNNEGPIGEFPEQDFSGSDNLIPEKKWNSIVKTIRQSQSIEDMITEQHYMGFDRSTFDRLIDALDVQDPRGDLLQQLRA